jgi:hypothetical protein
MGRRAALAKTAGLLTGFAAGTARLAVGLVGRLALVARALPAAKRFLVAAGGDFFLSAVFEVLAAAFLASAFLRFTASGFLATGLRAAGFLAGFDFFLAAMVRTPA